MSMLSSNSSCTPKDIKNQSDLVKFDVQTGFEEFLAGLRNLSVVLAILLTIAWILEGTQPIPLQLVLGTVLVAAGFVVLSLGTDSHYLVDPKAHVIYSVFVIFGRRRMRLVVQKKDMRAVTVQGFKRIEIRGQFSLRAWWEYRLVVVCANGKILPMSDWRRDSLRVYDRLANRLGKMLACNSQPGEKERLLKVEVRNDGVNLCFKPLVLGLTPRYWWVFGVLALFALVALVLS